jgi:hypothetical protein
VSYPPILNFDDALPCDEKEEEDEFLSLTNPACYDTDSDTVDNIDEFIHVGRRRWDIVGYDLDPIYDTEVISSCFPCSCHSRLLMTNGNKEMKFLLVTFKTPRMT